MTPDTALNWPADLTEAAVLGNELAALVHEHLCEENPDECVAACVYYTRNHTAQDDPWLLCGTDDPGNVAFNLDEHSDWEQLWFDAGYGNVPDRQIVRPFKGDPVYRTEFDQHPFDNVPEGPDDPEEDS